MAALGAETLDAVGSVFSFLLSPSQMLEILVPSFLIGLTLPHRLHFRRRLALVFAGTFLAMCVLIPASYPLFMLDSGAAVGNAYSFISSVVMLLACVPLFLWCFDTSVWRAFFCVGAGYTLQNIGSALYELVILLLRRVGGVDLSITATAGGAVIIVSAIISLSCYLLVLWLAWLLFIQQVGERGLSEVEDKKMLVMVFFVMFAVIAFDVVIKWLDDIDTALTALLALRLVHFMVCAFTLFVQYEMLYSKTLEAEMAAERLVAAEREAQHQLSRQNIEAINQKCHDIKHQIRQLAGGVSGTVDQEFLASVEREVDVYDAVVETGNEALTTILTEKGHVCDQEGISLSCIADGAALDFMAPSEIYSFFGNALDNAIRAVRALDGETERRSISVVVRRVGALVSIHIENGFEPAANGAPLDFEDGLPKTTQEGPEHGFGTRSMKSLVERRGGTIAFTTRDSVFEVNALVPLP